MKKLLLLLLFTFFTFPLTAQTIEGFITTSEGDTLFTANVLFKEASSPTSIREFVIARNGVYQYTFKKDYDTLLIEVKSIGYITQTKFIVSPQKDKNYKLDFVMSVDTTQLKEVTVRTKRNFEEKGDTVVYNAEAYKDGSERKVEDLLKKLPGVEVDEKTGTIKYKGKTIETVTLEGDNLFGQNYTLGTRNINVDMVEQVEAIENYNENPLLKGVDSGEKVALNLKLKKGKVDFSGSVDAALGSFDADKLASLLNLNVLSITKNYKSFSTFAYNNIGANFAPYDYSGFSFNAEQMSEGDWYAQKVLPETYFSNFLESRLINVNNQVFGNYNGIFRIKKRLSIKVNLNALNDRITNEQFIENKYRFQTDSFTTSDAISIQKRPTQYRADVEIKYNTSKNSLLEYRGRIRQENINTPTFILQNGVLPLSLYLQTKDFLSKQELLFTQKLKDSKVLQFMVLNTYNSVPQTFTSTPSVIDSLFQNTQESEFNRNHTTAKLTLLGARKNDRYAFEIGIKNENSPYSSLLTTRENQNRIPVSSNNFEYNRFRIYQLSAYHWNFKRFKISPTYSLNYLWQDLNYTIPERSELEARNLLFEPALSINYRLNKISSLSGRVGYNIEPNTESNFFVNNVLTNSRSIQRNIPNLSLNKTLSYNLSYYYNNLFNQLDMQAGIFYSRNEGNFFNRFVLTPTLLINENFFLNVPTTSFTSNFKVRKYIDKIESTLSLAMNYGRSTYNNIVNSSELRSNQTDFWSTEFFAKTAFDIPINFESTFDFRQSRSKNEETNTTFINNSLQHEFKILIKPNQKWFASLNSEYFLPNLDQTENNYWFLSAQIDFSPENKKWRFGFMANNLLNIQNFEQVNVSDFASSVYQTSILPRHFLLHGSYSF